MRVCHDCGATAAETRFTGRKKPGAVSRCDDCASSPLAEEARRVDARRAEIAALRTARAFVPSRPHWTAPLFAALDPKRKSDHG